MEESQKYPLLLFFASTCPFICAWQDVLKVRALLSRTDWEMAVCRHFHGCSCNWQMDVNLDPQRTFHYLTRVIFTGGNWLLRKHSILFFFFFFGNKHTESSFQSLFLRIRGSHEVRCGRERRRLRCWLWPSLSNFNQSSSPLSSFK